MNRLEVVGEKAFIEPPSAEASQPAQSQMAQAATKMLLMALQALSQRFVVAISNLFTILTAASAFYLWLIALPEINTLKIVALSIYSFFILALNIYGRRK